MKQDTQLIFETKKNLYITGKWQINCLIAFVYLSPPPIFFKEGTVAHAGWNRNLGGVSTTR